MTNQATLYSTFLFPRPTFMEGVARLADILGALNQYNESSSSEIADERAIYADWAALAEDLRAAMGQVDPSLLESVQVLTEEDFVKIAEILDRLIHHYEDNLAIHE